jgi:hypothetical protein
MADEPDLTPGTSSEWVMYLQQLINHHYQATVVPESGEFDEVTAYAVRHLRQQNQLPEADDVDGQVWAVLTGTVPTGGRSSDPAAAGTAGGTAGGTADGNPWPEASSVKVWLNAFIPGSYYGNIDGVGAAAGHRLLPGPSSWFNDCFHTDDREFSSDVTASARMHSEMRLDLADLSMSEYHGIGETVEYDCEDGDEECRASADTSRMSWTDPIRAGNVVTVGLSAAANNPCFSGSFDIDYVGTVTIDLDTHSVSFDGAVNGFPAYEAYATINDGAGQELFTFGPAGTPADLAGEASLAVSGSVSF